MGEGLKANNTLTTLNLDCNMKTDYTYNPFTLVDILTVNAIGETGARHLYGALKSNKTLTELSLRGKHQRWPKHYHEQ